MNKKIYLSKNKEDNNDDSNNKSFIMVTIINAYIDCSNKINETTIKIKKNFENYNMKIF